MPTPIDRARRRTIAGAYALFAAAGVANIFSISQLATATASPIYAYAWITCLIVGGGLGIFGALSKRPTPEISGVILITTAVFVYAAVLLGTVHLGGRSLLSLAILAAILALLGARVLELIRGQRMQDRVDRRRNS